MSTTFAYEYYKRNRFALVLGTKKEDLGQRFMTHREGDRVIYKLDVEKDDLRNHPVITGFYDAKPQTSFSTDFSPSTNELNDIVSLFENAGEKVKEFLSAIHGKEIVEGLFRSLGNFVKGDLSGAGNDIKKIANDAQSGTNAPTKAVMSPTTLHWKGSSPITFDVKFIFIKPDGGPVKMNTDIELLMSTVGSLGFGAERVTTMKGPLGYNGSVFGERAVYDILTRNNVDITKTLHSLILKQGEVTVLDLRNILVITNVDIKTSEQLYIPDAKNVPSYKWITADVRFSTVCPVPAPLARTYTSMLSFYGINNERWARGEYYGHSSEGAWTV